MAVLFFACAPALHSRRAQRLAPGVSATAPTWLAPAAEHVRCADSWSLETLREVETIYNNTGLKQLWGGLCEILPLILPILLISVRDKIRET